ncbi:MAG TPA: sugar ABC transporter ATP-binding protein [Tepidisphaeraceae bacterium]|nr:sugar ABC transporter ATP-binding protein [Tepidisphaeraceae bacterium]
MPLLELKNITKRFPGVLALDSVSLSVDPGEVIALIGENGAGKSTLMKILGGVHQADEGEIRVDDKPITIRHVSDAIRTGIGFIHQELNVLDNLDIAGNVFLGREKLWGGPLKLLDRKAMREESRTYLRRLGLQLDPATPLSQLSIAQQQMVEIAKTLSQNARLLIMDEPTSSLTLTETDRLLETIADLKRQGVSVIFISHRLDEIKRCADRVVVLRDGKNAGALPKEQVSHDNMVRLMVGRELKDLFKRVPSHKQNGGLRVTGLRTRYKPQHTISFEVSRGEILGFAGLVGAGRSEAAQAIFGVEPALEGEIAVDGKAVSIRTARDAISAGIYLAPEDRRDTGLITEMVIRENITLPAMKRYTNALGLISKSRESKSAAEQCASLKVKAPSVETRVMNLSGGNQQKVVLGKWLAMQPRVIIFDEPTRGIDVGAKAEIYRLMGSLADNGVAIIMISSDMEEILGVADRIAVMHEGRITGVLAREQFNQETIMRLAVGKTANSQ